MFDPPQCEYTFEDFLRHFSEFTSRPYVADPGPMEATALRLFQYMRPEFGDEKESRFKSQRFLMILWYLGEHLEELDVNRPGFVGDSIM